MIYIKKIINYFPPISQLKRNDYYDFINNHRSSNKLIIVINNDKKENQKDIYDCYNVNKNSYLCNYKKPSINFWKLWYEDNRDRILIERKIYYQFNKEKIKLYYQNNRNRYNKNKEVINEKRRNKYKNDIDYRNKVNNYNKTYCEKNKDKIREYKREWIRNKRNKKKNDFLFLENLYQK